MDKYQSVIIDAKEIFKTIECDILFRKRVFKRIFDVIFSLLGLIVLAPLLLIVSIWIKVTTKEKVFYMQKRMGRNLELFNIYKFQTMVPDADLIGPLVTAGEDPRVTKPGKFLRKYKIDELPQLFNVLKGDMSFVGPRPEVPKYLPYYSNKHLKLFCIKPGITDNSSIELRDEETLLDNNSCKDKYYELELLPLKLNKSLIYLENISVLYDLKLVLMTIVEVMK